MIKVARKYFPQKQSISEGSPAKPCIRHIQVPINHYNMSLAGLFLLWFTAIAKAIKQNTKKKKQDKDIRHLLKANSKI